MAFSSIADAANAIGRLYGVFEAELLEKTHTVDESIGYALEVKGASFTWDSPPPAEEGKHGKKHGHGKKNKIKSKPEAPASDKQGATDSEDKGKNDEERVFNINNVNLTIPRGQLVAIVGPVGSGKTSLLQGLIGEMRKTAGSIVFGDSVGYCPQTAWIQVCPPLR